MKYKMPHLSASLIQPEKIIMFKNKISALRVSFYFLFSVFCLLPLAAQQMNLPPVTRETADNGIRYILAEYKRAPTLTLIAIFPGGATADATDKTGTAELTAALMTRGTATRTAPQIAEETDFLGASLDASASDERLTVSLGALAKDTDAGLDLFADVIRHATLPAEELERERQLEIAGLQALGDEPGAMATRVTNQVVYAGHPYGRESTITSLGAIKQDDLRAYYQKFVAPDRMILIAVGDFKSAEMLAKLKAKFGDWQKSGVSLPAAPPVPAGKASVVLVDKPDATQTQVRFVRVAIPRSSPDYFAAELASGILGGGFTSRLIDEIRVNKSLTYGISSRFGMEAQGGDFLVSTFTKIETTKQLLDATRAVLQKTATEGFSAQELKKINGYLAGQFAIGLQTPNALAGRLAEMAIYGLPDDYLQTYLAKLGAVPLADVNRVAKTYFAPDALSIILVAPGAKVKSQLSEFSNIETRPADAIAK